MKKRFSLLLVILLLVFGIVGCKDNNPEHTHAYVEGECSCGEKDPNYVKPNPIIPDEVDTSSIIEKREGKTYYTSPDVPATNSTNDGLSKESPLFIEKAFARLTAGDTLIVLDGTYKLSSPIKLSEFQNGNFASYIKVIAEHPNKAILDFSMMLFNGSNRGIQIDGDYWYFYGIDITGAGDNGMYIGGNNNIIELCKFYCNRDSGLQLGRANGSYTNIKDWPSNNLIKNCTSFDNYDDETYGENADGFAAKLTTGEGNVFDGCIAYRNCDDGWDMYAKSDSGNVGLTVLINCVSFENGMTLTPHHQDWRDKTSPLVYTTRDGDGIGFKLGGSQMEGSVYVENCLAYNNKLEGFADNSNPGVISMRNCTAYNNSVQVKEDGTIGPSDGLSRNFDIARKNMGGTNSDSYNNYYGLLSYSTNETDTSEDIVYSLGDTFKGSVGYSIFSKYSPLLGASKYYQFTSYFDGNSYESSKAGTEYTRGLNDDMFASVEHNFVTNNNEDLHALLRNADGSINIGNMMDVIDSELLTFCEGKQIGSDLNKSSWEEYNHFEWSTPTLGTATENYAKVLGAYDVLDIMCNPKAVFQDIKLLTVCNDCKVEWKSSDEKLVKVSTDEIDSFSRLTYVWGSVYRDRSSDKEVTLTATISYGGAKITKDFVINLVKDNPSIGVVTGHGDKYILEQYDNWDNPEVEVTNKTSYSNQLLEEGIDYEVIVEYKYASDKNSTFYKVSDVYTSVPGVYEVTYVIKSLIDSDDTISSSFYVYVSSDTAEIDVKTGTEMGIHVVQEGVRVNAELSSTAGYLYVYATNDTLVTASKIKEKGIKFDIKDEIIDVTVENENSSAYSIYAVFVNKAGTYTSKIYTAQVQIEQISTPQAFYNLVTNSTSPTTIYQLTQDLDFTGFNWKESTAKKTFEGLFDGNHHTISNITINGTGDKTVNIIYKIKGGTLINTKFHNISITGKGDVSTRVAIIGQMSDGTIDNVKLTNISTFGYQGVSALIGQVVGGVNYISRVSLENDENQSIIAMGKYCGGIVGNLQKDTSESIVELYVDNCYVNAVIGGTEDTGGYSGGIVGRYKNEYIVCKLQIERCVVYGQIRTGKNYAGGITGGCDNGTGSTHISNCTADVTLYYAGTVLGADLAPSVKNGSPIFGRQTLGSGIFTFFNNYGSFAEYNDGIADGEDYTSKITREYFWKTSLGLDLENLWTVNIKTGKAYLNYIEE